MLAFISLLAALAAPPVDVSSVRVSPQGAERVSIILGSVGGEDPDRIVCKRHAVVGSRRPQKICTTRMEWVRRQEEAALIMDSTRWTTGPRPDRPPR